MPSKPNRLNEHKLAAMFEHMLDGVCFARLITDDTGEPIDFEYVDVNPAFERNSDRPRDEVVGHRLTELYPGIENDPADWLGRYGHVVRTGEPTQFEGYSAHLKRWFRVSAYRPEPEHFTMIFEDITDRKNEEQERIRLIADLEQKNAELERFLYTMSHDLRSPLITVRSFAGALIEDLGDIDSERLEADLRRISMAADGMSSLIEDLLQMSRVGRIMHEAESVTVATLCADAQAALAATIAETGAVIEVAPDTPVVYGDRARMVEVFQNLFENAIKFSGPAAPHIRVSATLDGDRVACAVADNGLGIEPEYQDLLFGLFSKMDADAEGSGLGLSIVRRIVQLLGGQIEVESAGRGAGATFIFSLPRPPLEVTP